MIAEAFLYATATTRPDLRRLGLVGDAVALWSRATRRRSAWASHEQRCRRLVGGVVAGLPRRDTVLVLGSGLMRDVPLADLGARFGRVILADAVHLLPVRLRGLGRAVEFATVDLTGSAAWLAGAAEGRGDPLAAFRSDPRIELVVSANCLSQLPMAPARRLRRMGSEAIRFEAIFGTALAAAHLGDLAGFRCPVSLISDVGYRDVEPDGREGEDTPLLGGIDLPPHDAEWDWEVAPRGELSRRFARVHRVRAWRDIRPQSGSWKPPASASSRSA